MMKKIVCDCDGELKTKGEKQKSTKFPFDCSVSFHVI